MAEQTCTAQYERPGGRQPGDRIVRCHLQAGHPGEHEEDGTEVTWQDQERTQSCRACEAVHTCGLPQVTGEDVRLVVDALPPVSSDGRVMAGMAGDVLAALVERGWRRG